MVLCRNGYSYRMVPIALGPSTRQRQYRGHSSAVMNRPNTWRWNRLLEEPSNVQCSIRLAIIGYWLVSAIIGYTYWLLITWLLLAIILGYYWLFGCVLTGCFPFAVWGNSAISWIYESMNMDLKQQVGGHWNHGLMAASNKIPGYLKQSFK